MRRSGFLVVALAHGRGHGWTRPRTSRALRQTIADLIQTGHAQRRRADQLELDLAHARKALDWAMGGASDLYWTLEVQPDGRLTLDFISTESSGMLGGPIPEGIDTAAARARLVHPDDVEASAGFTAAVRAGQAAEVEERLVGFDGVTRWTWSRGTPRHEADRLFFDGITTDITERHELEEQREALLQRERAQVAMLEEVHRTRDDFIALAGHELRTPLTVIQGYAEQILDDQSLSEEHRQQLETVVRRAGLMSDLIDDLFDLAKLDSDVEPIEFEPVRIDELVLRSVQDHESAAVETGNVVHLCIDPVTVLGERRRLRRMVDHMIDNAVRYSPSGGEITVSVGRDGDDALLRVTDEGIGIPPEEVSHVFDRLVRGSNAVEARIPGTGLGLSSVLAIAEGHGGTAVVDTGSSVGTVVMVRLPAH